MSIEQVHYLNVFLGIGAIILQVLSLGVLGLVLFSRKHSLLSFINKHFVLLVFLISLSGALFSLVYSEIVGFLPCFLCWWQRIFLYPLVFISGAALWKKENNILHYIMPLTLVGLLVSIYQNYGYYFKEASSLPCDASGVSCYQQLIYEFGGYISIPMLALTSFFALFVLCLAVYFYNKE